MNKTYSITLIALGAALIVALSPFQIALGPIPITLQTLVIGLLLHCIALKKQLFPFYFTFY